MANNGLTTAQAKERQKKYGYNTITEKVERPWLKFLSYFWGPISWMIEAAAVLSIVVRDWLDLTLILILLFSNSLIRYWEERKANNAIAQLKKQLAISARVLRDGEWKTIPASDLVPDDVVTMQLGDIVPADVLLTDSSNVEVDQAALTGESLPVERKEGDTLYSGSILSRGDCRGVVTEIGESTYFGKTAQLVKKAKSTDHFQQAVMRIGRFLIGLTIILILCILVAAIIRDTPMLETVQFLLILTVAAIPVALPAVLSVTMAVGATQLSKLKAIVSRLESIEELAGMDVLCSDKTGTLTQNKLKIQTPVLFADIDKQQLLSYAALDCNTSNPDVIDRVILDNVKDSNYLKNKIIVDFVPFDPVSKRSQVTVEELGKRFVVSKGAPAKIVELCELDQKSQEDVNRYIDDYAERGYRTLGVAKKEEGDAWVFLGLLPLFDPVREDSADTIAQARSMHVSVKMITGDHLAIAKEVGRELDLGDRIVEASHLPEADLNEAQKMVEDVDGFAQVFPQHKYQIVDHLQKNNHIVGMTGDGVNDAPALKKADVGIAVSGATDAARSAADLVLTAPGLGVIVHAIKKARQIFERMNAYSIYRIAETLRVLFFLSFSILIFDYYPLTAVMVIILALLNDIPIMTIAYDNARVNRKPVRWRMPKVLTIASLLGLFGVFSSFVLLALAKYVWHLDREMIMTMMFLKMTASGHMTIYLARTGHKPFYVKPWPSPILFFTTEITQVIGTLFAVYGWLMPAIGWKWALVVWGYSMVEFVLNDWVKMAGYRLARYIRLA